MQSAQRTHVSLSRQELLDLVWSKSLAQLARDYSITDVGLRKLCRRHQVPLPKQGHWARREDRRRRKPKLPAAAPALCHIRLFVRAGPETLEQDAADLLTAAGALPPIAIREFLRGAHPLAREIGKTIKPARRGHAESARLHVNVSPSLVRRSKLLLDALLGTLTVLDVNPVVDSGDDGPEYVFVVLGVRLRIVIYEQVRAADEKELERINRRQGWISQRGWIPNGRISLLLEPVGPGRKHTWNDTDHRPVEDVIDQIPRRMVRLAMHLRDRRRAMDAERQKWDDYWRSVEEERARKEREQARIKELRSEAIEWARAQELRAYIEAVRTQTESAGEETPKHVAEWLSWAEVVAASTDPLPSRVEHVMRADDDGTQHTTAPTHGEAQRP